MKAPDITELIERLTSFFYQLARDKVSIGLLNEILIDTVGIEISVYSDDFLEQWARNFSKCLVNNKLPIKLAKLKKKEACVSNKYEDVCSNRM
jgi:hypothetical protein